MNNSSALCVLQRPVFILTQFMNFSPTWALVMRLLCAVYLVIPKKDFG